MSIKKTILKKKIEGVVYDLYLKTSADIVVYDETDSVASKIASIVTTLTNLTTGDNSVDKKIEAASDALFQKIMGVTDQSQLNQAFDTLKEVSEYLAGHGSVVDGFTADIAALKTAVGDADSGLTKEVNTLKTTVGDANSGLVKGLNTVTATVGDSSSGLVADVTALQGTVGGSDSGLVKDVNDLKTTVGDDASGLVKDVADLKAAGSTKVEASDTNGYIKINGAETKVYDDSAIAATKIVEDATHRFTTDTEKAAWNANAEVIVADSVPEDLAETDLLFLVIPEV